MCYYKKRSPAAPADSGIVYHKTPSAATAFIPCDRIRKKGRRTGAAVHLPVNVIRSYIADNVPIEYSLAHYRGDRNKFQVTILPYIKGNPTT